MSRLRARLRTGAGQVVLKGVPARLRRGIAWWKGDTRTKRFIEHNRTVWRGWKTGGRSVVLVDFYSIPQTIISYSYFANVMARQHGASIQTFGAERWLTSRNAEHHLLGAVYESFNATDHLVLSLDRDQRRRRDACVRSIFPLKTKEDLLQLRVQGVWIGVEIYESYIGRLREPTVRLDDPRLREFVEEGVGALIFWLDFFARHDVVAVVVSHDSYLEYVITKVAFEKRVPVYMPSAWRIVRIDRPYAAYEHFKEYRRMFQRLDSDEQDRALALARERLDLRFRGEVGVDMPYSKASAFGAVGSGPVLRPGDKTKVLICTHCFFDNPQCFGGTLFVDFYEWLQFLGRMSERTDYDWYLKTHPDPLPGTDEVIQDILARFPRITQIPSNTSHHQLVRDGLDVVLTVYGSVGHELPALGVQVVNAGYNPRIAYDFNWHARTLGEYEDYLLQLDGLEKPIDLEQMYEFYYMHHFYGIADDLFLDSYADFTASLPWKDQIGPAAYAYFLERLTTGKHERIIRNVTGFLDSGKRHYFSRGPE